MRAARFYSGLALARGGRRPLLPRPRRHRLRPRSPSLRRFVESKNPQVKRRRAQLLLTVHELAQKSGTGIVTYGDWALARNLENLDAIRQDLHRRRKDFARVGARLSFSSPTIDLRGLQQLVRRELEHATKALDAPRTEVPGRALSPEGEPNKSPVCLHCGMPWRIPVEELLSLRSGGSFASMRELRRRFHVGHERLKAMLVSEGLERRPGNQPIETKRTRSEIDEARELASSGKAHKVRVIEVAQVLGVSHRTAARFIARARARQLTRRRRRK